MLADRSDAVVKITPTYYIYSYVSIPQCRLTESQALGVVTSCSLSIAHGFLRTSGYLVFASSSLRLKNNAISLTLKYHQALKLEEIHQGLHMYSKPTVNSSLH